MHRFLSGLEARAAANADWWASGDVSPAGARVFEAPWLQSARRFILAQPLGAAARPTSDSACEDLNARPQRPVPADRAAAFCAARQNSTGSTRYGTESIGAAGLVLRRSAHSSRHGDGNLERVWGRPQSGSRCWPRTPVRAPGGDLASYLAGAHAERAHRKHELSSRWDESRRQAYAAYGYAIKNV